MPLINTRFNVWSQEVFDWIYFQEEPEHSTWWRRLAVKPLKILLTFIDLAYARAGYLFGGNPPVTEEFHDTFDSVCLELMNYYDDE